MEITLLRALLLIWHSSQLINERMKMKIYAQLDAKETTEDATKSNLNKGTCLQQRMK